MYATGFVNSINMSEWENGALKLVSQEPQVIITPWYFGKNLTFEDTLESVNGIYDFDINEEMQQMRKEKEYKSIMEGQFVVRFYLMHWGKSVLCDFLYLIMIFWFLPLR